MNKYEPTLKTLKAMINKAQEKLEVAKVDFESGYYGDASSRAYYAVFHAISAVLAAKGFTFTSHAQTIGAFNREFIKVKISPLIHTEKFKDFSMTARWQITIGVLYLMKTWQNRILSMLNGW